MHNLLLVAVLYCRNNLKNEVDTSEIKHVWLKGNTTTTFNYLKITVENTLHHMIPMDAMNMKRKTGEKSEMQCL